MDRTTLEALIERISRDPSVLLLGQNYLASKSGQNPFGEELSRRFASKGINPDGNYSEIWECLIRRRHSF